MLRFLRSGARLSNVFGVLEAQERVKSRFHYIVRVRSADGLRKHVRDARNFHYRAHWAARNNSRAFRGGLQHHRPGAKTAERFGWKIGDRIPIKTTLYGGGSWEFNLAGIYHGKRPQDDETQFWFQWDYFEERMPQSFKGNVGWYVLKLDGPDDAPRVAKAIDDMFANSPYETKSETESAFAAGWVKQFGNIEFLILSIGSVVFFTLLLVTGNTMAISVRERIAELGVLKAIGVSDRSVLFLVLAESVTIAFFGGVLGLALALVMIPGIGAALTGMLPPLLLSKPMLSFGLGFAILVGVISGLLPGIGAMRMRVVNALRRV